MNDVRPLLFIHIPGTGGTSACVMFRWFGRRGECTSQVVRHIQDFQGVKNVAITRVAHCRVCDFDAAWVKQRLVAAFVRNPWDRVVSQWDFAGRHRSQGKRPIKRAQAVVPELAKKDFHQYVLYITSQDAPQGNLNAPQAEWLRCEGTIVPAFIGRFETLDADWGKLCRLVGLPNVKLPHYNAGNHKPYREYYNRRDRARIANLFRDDIEEFGYEF